MSDDRYRFTSGDFECLAIKDTSLMVNGEQLFSNIDKDVYKPQLKARGEKHKKIEIPINTLAVRSDDWVLIDAGYGTIGEDAGELASILKDEEIRPEHIILSHAHPDHFGGLLDKNGDETFGNTPIYICQREWMLMTSAEFAGENPGRAGYIEKYLLPVERQIERIECLNMSEILPGFSVIRLPGHTENHIGILIESQGEKIIFAGDAVVHPLHLENLDWQCSFDADPGQARESRIKLAELAIELDAPVMATHFPFPGIGRIEQHGTAYKWHPIET